MKITVIIPAYNARNQIGECLSSLLEGGVRAGEHEVIVVDDGSSDDTPELVRNHYGRVRLIRSDHAGPYAARNIGISHAHGEILVFLDADCVAPPGWLDRIERSFDADTHFLMGRLIPENAFLHRVVSVMDFPDFVGNRARGLSNFACVNLACKADMIRKFRFQEDCVTGADRLLSWKLHKLGYNIRYEPLLAVLHRPGLAWRELFRRRYRYCLGMLKNRDRDRSLPGGGFYGLGPMTPAMLALGRLSRDFFHFLSAKKALKLNFFGFPLYFFLFSLFRSFDLAIMSWILLRGAHKR